MAGKAAREAVERCGSSRDTKPIDRFIAEDGKDQYVDIQ
jgi:hypothetical protein